MEIIFMVVSFVIGSLITFGGVWYYIMRQKEKYILKDTIRKSLKKKSKKEGLLKQKFTFSDPGGDATKDIKVDLTIEFVVSRETDDKVKISVVECVVNHMSYSKDHHIDMYKKAFSRWYDKNDKDIEWLKEDKHEIRKRKLKELLK